PVWSHDGERIAFASDRYGGISTIWTLILTTGAVQQVATHDGWMPTWSPDDRALAFLCRPPVDQARPLMARPTVVCVTDVTGIVRQLLAPPSEALAWSPDGAHFAIVQNLGLRMGSIGGSASLSSSTSGGVRIQGLGRPNEENVFPFRPDWLSDGEVL